MTSEVMLKELGLDKNASFSEIQSSIEDKKSELEYMILAIDDESTRQEYLNKIKELKLAAKVFLTNQVLSKNSSATQNIHHLFCALITIFL